jgi:dCTP deaminase
MVLPDHMIRKLAREKGMIEPCAEPTSGGVVSFGISSFGYDMRVSDQFKIHRVRAGQAVDPKQARPEDFESFQGPVLELPPHTYGLGHSVEYFRIPRDVIALCTGKSTYARCGVLVNITPLEPEWEGHLTVQIANLTPVDAELYSGEGIAQLVFLTANTICEKSYNDVSGNYQASSGIILSK